MNHSNCWFAALLVFAGMMIGCNASTGKRILQSTSEARARDALVQAMSALLGAKSFRIRMDATLAGEKMTWETADIVAPDRLHMNAMDDFEQISIGPDMWRKYPNLPWHKFEVDYDKSIVKIRNPKAVDIVRQSTDVMLIGPDTLDGLPMTVYQYTLPDGFGAGSPIHYKVWVAADFLPRRVEFETQVSGMALKASTSYFDYNVDIKIEPPK